MEGPNIAIGLSLGKETAKHGKAALPVLYLAFATALVWEPRLTP